MRRLSAAPALVWDTRAPLTGSFVLLFLPSRQFLKPGQRFIDLVVPLLTSAALKRLILIPQFVEIELVEVGQLFGRYGGRCGTLSGLHRWPCSRSSRKSMAGLVW